MTVTLRPRLETPSPTRTSVAFGRRHQRGRITPTWPPSNSMIATVVATLLTFGFWLLVGVQSESAWYAAALTYVPRLPLLVLAGGLTVWTALNRSWRLAVWNACVAAIVLGPIMDFRTGALTAPAAETASTIKIVSCNAQGFRGAFSETISEIVADDPDVIAFQEAPLIPQEVADHFRDRYSIHSDEFYVVSRFPLELLGECNVDAFDRMTAIKVRVDVPERPFQLIDVHQMTARRGLVELTPGQVVSGEGQMLFEVHQMLRRQEAAATRVFATDTSDDLPLLVVGDFNTPSTSSLHEGAWTGLRNAFDEAGWGWGYTAPNRGPGLWPDGLPWLRIDHILCSDGWTIHACDVGRSNGSDHRLIRATLSQSL